MKTDEDTIHVFPVNDFLVHESDEGCACLPVTEPVARDDGSFGWICVHHAWDGRE